MHDAALGARDACAGLPTVRPGKDEGQMEVSAVNTIRNLLRMLGKPRLAEFDYRDSLGLHHGRCYVSCLFGSRPQIERLLRRYGYTNIHVA